MPRFRRYAEGEQCYFVTSGTHERRPLFRDPRLCLILLENLRFYHERMNFGLHGYVIMPNHIHLLITPREGSSISDIMRNLKSYAAREMRHALGIDGPVWQRRFYDRIVRGEAQFLAALDYMHENPVQAGVVESAGAYEFSSRRFWEDGSGPIELDGLDGHGWGRDLRRVEADADG